MTLNSRDSSIYPWEFGWGDGSGGGGGGGGNGVSYGGAGGGWAGGGNPNIGLPSGAHAGQIGGAIDTSPGSPAAGLPSWAGGDSFGGRQNPPAFNNPSMGIPQDTNAGSVGGSNIPNFYGRDKQGNARYSDPNVTWKDRLGRGAKGALQGYDTGSKVGNIATNVGSSLVGLGTANRVAGAAQGLASNKPVSRTWKGGTFDPSQAPSATGSNAKNVPAASQTALQQALSGDTSNIHRPQGGAQVQGGGEGYWNNRPNGAANWGPTAGQLPAPGTIPPKGGPGGIVAGAPPTAGQLPAPGTIPDPDGIEAPKLGTPQGTAALNYLYNQYYGRDATPDEIAANSDNPGGLDAVAAMLAGDEENHIPIPGQGAAGPQAQNDALKQILSGGQNYQTDGSNGRIGVAGAGGGYEFAGFDFAQDPANRDIGKSAKYAFSHLAGQAAGAGAPQPRTKAEAEAWFTQHIKPGMDALGFTVHKVQGDKAFISAPEHPDGAWVDFVINADGGGATPLAWQAELGGAGGDADPESLFAVQGGWGGGPSGMDRGEEGLGSSAVGGVLDSGNKPLDSFAQRLIQQLLEGAALDDAVGREQRATRGITPQGLASVGF